MAQKLRALLTDHYRVTDRTRQAVLYPGLPQKLTARNVPVPLDLTP
jgi:hypothetical protein